MRSMGIGVFLLITLPGGHVGAGDKDPAPGAAVVARGGCTEAEPPAGADAAARDRAARSKLETRVTLRHPKAAPLTEVVAEITRATRGPDDAGLPVYVDPVGLALAGKSGDAPVTIDVEGVPLKVSLRRVLEPLGLTTCLYEGVLVITAAGRIGEDFANVRAPARDATAKSRAVLAKLQRPVPMHYPQLTPIGRVLKDIKRATAGPGDPGLPIYVSPEGLRDAEKTPDSPVTINLDGVPLRTTLRLVLRQLGMDYYVRDGLLRITTASSEEFAPG